MTAFAIEVDGRTVRIRGDLDLHTAPELAEAAATARELGEVVHLDLHDVTFIDSVALRELIRLDRSGGVLLVNPSERVLQLLEVSGTTELFTVRGRDHTAKAVTETQLCACLSALDRAGDGERSLWLAAESLANANADDLVGTLRMIHEFGYIEIDADDSGAIERISLTDAGRRFVEQTC